MFPERKIYFFEMFPVRKIFFFKMFPERKITLANCFALKNIVSLLFYVGKLRSGFTSRMGRGFVSHAKLRAKLHFFSDLRKYL